MLRLAIGASQGLESAGVMLALVMRDRPCLQAAAMHVSGKEIKVTACSQQSDPILSRARKPSTTLCTLLVCSTTLSVPISL